MRCTYIINNYILEDKMKAVLCLLTVFIALALVTFYCYF